LDPKLSTIANEGKKKGDKKDKKKNKKNTYNQREQKKDEAWTKEPPKDSEKRKKKLANTLTTGVSTTWHGRYTSLLIVCGVNSTRKNRRRSLIRRTLVPLLLPLQPQ
jgi:hypothetical protein